MKYSWIYLICFSDSSVGVALLPIRANVVEYDFEGKEEEFYFDGGGPGYCKQTLCRHGIADVFEQGLKPGEYIELRVTEQGDES